MTASPRPRQQSVIGDRDTVAVALDCESRIRLVLRQRAGRGEELAHGVVVAGGLSLVGHPDTCGHTLGGCVCGVDDRDDLCQSGLEGVLQDGERCLCREAVAPVVRVEMLADLGVPRRLQRGQLTRRGDRLK